LRVVRLGLLLLRGMSSLMVGLLRSMVPGSFILGDDAAWAGEGFDDSGWEKLAVNKPWGAQGHADVDGFAWYRRHVVLQPGQQLPDQLAILIPAVEGSRG
jgi:hypothetical protein